MDLIERLKGERSGKIRGIYWLLQINLAFNSNKIEGSRLSKEQTQYLFDESKIYTAEKEVVSVRDIQETINHFKAFDYILDNVNDAITIDLIKTIHSIIKKNTPDEDNPLTPVGEFKVFENVIGAINPVTTSAPENVEKEMKILIESYLKREDNIKLEDIVDFHVEFEKIHPFADGNGRVGRLIIFKECLKNNIVPSIVLDEHRHFYLKGLDEYRAGSKERLIETFKAGQDFAESILNQLRFEGDINKTVENINQPADHCDMEI